MFDKYLLEMHHKIIILIMLIIIILKVIMDQGIIPGITKSVPFWSFLRPNKKIWTCKQHLAF